MPENTPSYIQELTQKFLNGSISASETDLLNQWYEQQPQLRPEWLLDNESRAELKGRLYRNIRREMGTVRKMYPTWMKVAAAVILIVTTGILITRLNRPDAIQQYTINNQQGHIRKITLPDHSLVWLKGNSSLDYPAQFDHATRNVTLRGEALFEVSKDRHHPFIIKNGNYEVKVLGTSFNIRSNQAGAFKLTVLTGKVQVSAKGEAAMSKTVLVTPGQSFESAGKSNLSSITRATLVENDAVVSGTQYPMNFEETGFEEIRHRVEAKFDVSIETGDTAYQQCRISANVTDQSLENTLKVICAAIGATYHINKNVITITGGGCI